MCGRYSFAPQKQHIESELNGIEIPESYAGRYNIAPTEASLVLTFENPQTLQWMAWGLVPHWSKDGINKGKLINARSETIFDKPSFRDAILHRRCMIPADSFYEWRNDPTGKKIPYRIQRADNRLIWMAGIWETWGKEKKRTFSILTTEPNAEMKKLHNRMPVILWQEQDCKLWLDPQTDIASIQSLMQKPPDHCLQYYRISSRINAAGADDPALQLGVPETTDLFGNEGF